MSILGMYEGVYFSWGSACLKQLEILLNDHKNLHDRPQYCLATRGAIPVLVID